MAAASISRIRIARLGLKNQDGVTSYIGKLNLKTISYIYSPQQVILIP